VSKYVLNISAPLPEKNRRRNSPAVKSITMEIQGCLEVMLQSNVVNVSVT
jgi:hypothetical protein